MRLIFGENSQRLCRDSWNLPFHVVLLSVVWSTGCNNSCFTFTSNPPNGTVNIKVSNAQPSCTLTKATGAVHVVLQTVPPCGSCSESPGIQHLFVTIRSIDIHASSTADDDSPDWQQLAPQLATQPLQVDLVGGMADRGTLEPLGEIVAIPAGIYHQVRVRFARHLLATDDRLTRKNACVGGTLNCAVKADGTVHPLLLDTASPELRITSERITDGFLLVFPDMDSDLVIELKPVWTWFASANRRNIGVLPVLTGNAWVERVGYDDVGASAGDLVRDPLSK